MFVAVARGESDHQLASTLRVTVKESVDAGEDWVGTVNRATENAASDGSLMPRVSYRVRCDPGYYGPRCALACNARQDKFGHYECDKNGTRSCLDGWTGKFCDTREFCLHDNQCNKQLH